MFGSIPIFVVDGKSLVTHKIVAYSSWIEVLLSAHWLLALTVDYTRGLFTNFGRFATDKNVGRICLDGSWPTEVEASAIMSQDIGSKIQKIAESLNEGRRPTNRTFHLIYFALYEWHLLSHAVQSLFYWSHFMSEIIHENWLHLRFFHHENWLEICKPIEIFHFWPLQCV